MATVEARCLPPCSPASPRPPQGPALPVALPVRDVAPGGARATLSGPSAAAGY